MLSWLAHVCVICKTHAFPAKKALCDGEKKIMLSWLAHVCVICKTHPSLLKKHYVMGKKKNLQAEIWQDLIQA
jgi:hypothetical protein